MVWEWARDFDTVLETAVVERCDSSNQIYCICAPVVCVISLVQRAGSRCVVPHGKCINAHGKMAKRLLWATMLEWVTGNMTNNLSNQLNSQPLSECATIKIPAVMKTPNNHEAFCIMCVHESHNYMVETRQFWRTCSGTHCVHVSILNVECFYWNWR